MITTLSAELRDKITQYLIPDNNALTLYKIPAFIATFQHLEEVRLQDCFNPRLAEQIGEALSALLHTCQNVAVLKEICHILSFDNDVFSFSQIEKYLDIQQSLNGKGLFYPQPILSYIPTTTTDMEELTFIQTVNIMKENNQIDIQESAEFPHKKSKTQ